MSSSSSPRSHPIESHPVGAPVRLLRLALRALQAAWGAVYLFDGSGWRLIHQAGASLPSDPLTIPALGSLFEIATTTQSVIKIEDAPFEVTLNPSSPEVLTTSWLGIQNCLDDSVRVLLLVADTKTRHWSEEEIETLRDAAEGMVETVQPGRHFDETPRLEDQLREETQINEILFRLGTLVSAELDLEKLVQTITDTATQLTSAAFGAFFYNVLDEKGEAYTLYTLSGAPREAFEKFPMPRNTAIFDPTFRGEGVLRLADVMEDPRYGQNPPYSGMPEGHLPVRSYLAVPVVSRSGEVHGGLFFGHPQPSIFTERHERILVSLAAQAAVAMDNARLFESSERERILMLASEKEYRSLAEALPQLVYTARPNGYMDYYNAQWFQYTGLTREESRGWGWEKVIHPEDIPICADRWKDAVRHGKTFEIEYRILRARDGAYRWHLGRAVPMTDEEGRVFKWLGTCTDIDDQKRAEESLLLLSEASAMLASSFDSDASFDHLAHLIVPLLADLCTIDMLETDETIRRLATAHMDVTLEELSKDLWRRYPVKLEEAHDLLNALSQGKGLLIPDITDTDLRNMAKDEAHLKDMRRLKPRSAMIVPLFARNRVQGGISFWSCESGRRYGPEDLRLAEEVAHRAAVAMDNLRLYQEVQRADRAKEDFLAMLAHELRNPLSPILNALHLMKLRENDPAISLRARGTIERQVRHMTRIIDDLLDVSRITQGKIDLQFETLDLAAFSQTIMEDHRASMEQSRIRPEIQLPTDPVYVEADPARLSQILGNLIHNAVKFTDAEGQITLVVEAVRESSRGIVTLRDTGIGLDPEMLPLIFDPFTQADRSLERSRGGLGLGLALVKGLVALHHGEVRVNSDGQGKGSEFSFWLPLQSSEAAVSSTHIDVEISAARSVLIIEDNVDTAESLRDLLELWGYEVEVAHSGPKGVELARRFQPQIVLCDIGLPGMDGFAVAQALRKTPEMKDALLISVSGYGQPEDRKRSKESGFDRHLIKPVDLDDLQRILRLGGNR